MDDLERAFETLGITPLEERVYEVLMDGPRATLGELSKLVQVPRSQVQRALNQLRGKGLVTETATRPREYVAAPPEAAVEVLVLRKEEELHHVVHGREQELHRARLAAARLGERHRAGLEKLRTGDLLEMLAGPEASAQRFQQLLKAAREEMLIIDRPPYAAELDVEAELRSDRELLDRGIKVRSIYSDEALEIPGRLAIIQQGLGAAGGVRVLPDVPTKLVIIDRKVGLIPLNLQQFGIQDAVVVHASFLLHALTLLFESLWEMAVPLASLESTEDEAEHVTRDEMLALLAAGLKDESVARVLRVSRRTVTRRMRELMEELGAKTRFQAGILAERRLRVGE